MNNEECRQLLSVLSDIHNEDEKFLKNVSDKLDRQPLFLANSASYVGRVKSVNPTFTWEKYFDKLNEGERQNMDGYFQKINSSYLGMKTVMLAVQKNAEESILLEHVFKLFSIISFDPLPQDVIIQFIKSIDPQKSAEDICLQLKHCSLFFQTENNDIRVHSVVHEAIVNYSSQTFGCKQSENNSKKSAADLACQVAWALNRFEDREDEIKIIPHLIKFITNSSFQHFLNKLIDVKSSKQKLDERNWKIAKYFVDVLVRFCNYKLATKVLYEITEIQTKMLGVDHIDVSYSYNELGGLLWKNGEYENAKAFLERAMKIQAKTFGTDHVNIAATYNNLGSVYNDMGEYEKAKDFYERAIEIETKAFGPDHVNIATTTIIWV
ncbi:kinesin light chain 1-like [Xenia sp. Carnegie-2017]|uniref:kinesin light chain 1-like n=1 Tax=Xenia sp. Carnegie-2017 TaxID=2897299 RepID=UPI001F049553|nr:kinesin light chain 1-like [Xenia sp. Carnegie-2017]